MALASAINSSVPSAESITSNEALYWERFNSSQLCFESELSVPIQVVDVLQTGQVQSHRLSNDPAFTSYFGNQANSNFKSRLM
jgi:hypothetical protein